jgi:hypothetical protein
LSTSQPPFAGMIDPDVTDAYDVTALLPHRASRIALHAAFGWRPVISPCSRHSDCGVVISPCSRLLDCGAVLAGVKAKPSGWPFAGSGPALTPAPGDAGKAMPGAGGGMGVEGVWRWVGLGHQVRV